MSQTSTFINSKSIVFFVIAQCLFLGNSLYAQTPVTSITDYAIWGGTLSVQSGQTAPASPGYGVQVGYSSIQGGSVGSYKLVKSIGNTTWGTSTNKTNIYSGGTIVLANSNAVNGKIAAGTYNTAAASGIIFSAGTSEVFNGNIDINGNIVIGGGTVSGVVTNPVGTTYKLGTVTKAGTGTPTLPILPPLLPVITNFPGSVGTTNITSGPIGPGNYGNLTIGGNKTVTLNGPGIYRFKSITTTGPNSQIVYNFNGTATGNFLIYVDGDVILNRTSCSIIGGSATRIFTEVHGTGSTNSSDKTVTFSMSNGSNGNGNTSSWFGSVWAPFAAIKIGTPNGPAMAVQGAFWSGTQVNIVDGVNILYNPSVVNTCNPPVITSHPTAPPATCSGSGIQTINVTATGTGLTYSWRKGGVAVANGGAVSGQGTSTLTLTNPTAVDAGNYDVVITGTCAVATSNAAIVTVNALPTISGSLNVCINSKSTLVGSQTPNATIPWVSATPGVATINSLGEVTGVSEGTSLITYKNSNGCTVTATITVNPLPVIVDAAGPDKPYNFNGITAVGKSDLTGFTFKWTAPAGGSILTPDDQATINVSAPGLYKLAIKSGLGCVSTDDVIVSNKVRTLIGSELSSVYWNNPNGDPSPFFIIKDGNIRIDIIVNVGNYDYVLNLLQQTTPENYGLINIVTNGENGLNKKELIITGDYPIANLLKLNALYTYINYCRPFYEAFSNSGLVNSAGDTTMRSNFVRSGYKINGAGVKVGVISNSFATITSGTTPDFPLQPVPIPQTFRTNTAAQDVSNGDLPAVAVLQDLGSKSTDEGRAMAQIVHDVAPGAQIYFRTGFLTAGDFATGIKELRAAGCSVIVDDVTYITEPFLRDGVVAQTVDQVKAQGVSYFSAAGNFANRSYEKDFAPVDAAQAGFAGLKAHNFEGGDIFQHITLAPGNYTIVLQWVDDIYSIGETNGTKYDLDMFWTSNTDGTGLKGFNRDNTNGDPIEILPFIITASTDASFLIVNNTLTGNPARIKYVVYRGDVKILEYNDGTSTLVGQANAAGAIAVGAARFDKVPSYKPYNLTAPLIEDFSSIGGTKTEGVVRQKPDLVAPDGGNTTVKMGQDYSNTVTGVQLDGYSNFFGTSAAAPHAAAVAALIMEGKKKFQGFATTSPDVMKSLLQSTAVDMEIANNQPGTKFDFISGYGLVDADSAMRTFAAPTPALIEVVVPPAAIPCSGVPFTVSITGENFSRNTVVYLINGPGDSTKIIPTFVSSTEVTVTISSCVGNPEIKAYTPPKAGANGTDGGFSNSKYFFSAVVTVDAISINKKYGETLVALDTVIRINGKLLQDTTVTLQEIGLDNMTVTTAATSGSDVGTYAITLNRTFDPNNTADKALLKKYSYKFTNGIVTIAKMPLRVTPDNKTITYGQTIGNVTFKYEFNTANVSNPNDLRNTIKSFHDAYLPNNALAVVKDFKKPQANGGYVLSNTDLANMNMMASFKAVKNSRKFKLASNMLEPITDPNDLKDNLNIQYLVDIASESIYDYAKIDKTKAKFYPVYPNINPKALLSASSIESDDNSKGIVVNGGTGTSTLRILNGLLSPMIGGGDGPIAPIVNGSFIQLVDAEITDPASNPPILAQYVNDGSWVVITNGGTGGSTLRILNGGTGGSTLRILNGYTGSTSTLRILNGVTTVDGISPASAATIQVLANTVDFKVVNNIVYKIVNGVDVAMPNGSFVQLQDGGLVQVKDGSFQAVANTDPLLSGYTGTGSTLRILNGGSGSTSTLRILNGYTGTGSTLRILNSGALGTDSPNNNTAVVLDSEDGTDDGDGTSALGNMFGINMITGLDVGKQYLVPGVLVNPNFDISYGLGEVNIAPATITVTANNVTRKYGENNQLKVTYSGFAPGDSLQNNGSIGITGVTGTPSLTTTATQYSPVGNYPITVGTGTLASPNYAFTVVNGILTIIPNNCPLLVHDPMNFVSTTTAKTSLWTTVTIKVSGQLVNNGDYIVFRTGDITLNNITSTAGNSPITIPNGKIVAAAGITVPITTYNSDSGMWITKVPLGFASTSDIFITGSIINADKGFVAKKNSIASSVLRGMFYSNKSFVDKWSYSMAAYQPQFEYSNVDGIADAGVQSINGTYRAGTPIPEIAYIVAGGSGNGGNNYTGSPSNQNAFTACTPSSDAAVNRVITNSSSIQQTVRQDVQGATLKVGEIQVYPNPASVGTITLSYVPAKTGNTKIAIMTLDGKKVFETNNGVWEAGKKYVKRIDVNRLGRGVYMVQVIGTDATTIKKIIISK